MLNNTDVLDLGEITLLKKLFSKDEYVFKSTDKFYKFAYNHNFAFCITDNGNILYERMGDVLTSPKIIAKVGTIFKNESDNTYLVKAIPGYRTRLADLLEKVSKRPDFSFVNIGLTDDKRYWVYEQPGVESIFAEIKKIKTII